MLGDLKKGSAFLFNYLLICSSSSLLGLQHRAADSLKLVLCVLDFWFCMNLCRKKKEVTKKSVVSISIAPLRRMVLCGFSM